MKVSRRTPRTTMNHDSAMHKIAEVYQEWAKQEGVESLALDRQVSRFGELSSRVTFENSDKADFELIESGDGPEVIHQKFLAYLDTERGDLITEAFKQMVDMLIVTDPATGPQPPEEEDKKEKKG